ncbi:MULTISPECIES: oxidoreductase [Sphingobium]|uniref:oxidoreductase n=1 Tax=Sphingobium sp. MI1205 TaxID=407020 RepID=UPI00076FE715|nr:oxidoreductase [Sphingobium sp. MI1205]AMK19924.1 short-chain dehydrogenase [Sphingobium sp. MI1205]
MTKTWFITGAARGIGASIARAAYAAGEQVVATARDVATLKAALGAENERLHFVQLDVTRSDQATAAVGAAMERFGRIDVLVNNAGYGHLGIFEEFSEQDIEQQFETNTFGVFRMCRAVLPIMRAQRSGYVVNISSIAGIAGGPGGSIYCASKHAVEGFSEALAGEVQPFGISVTIIEPGFFRTDFMSGKSLRFPTDALADYADINAAHREFYARNDGNQPGDPDRLAQIILQFAASDEPPLRFAAGGDAVEVILAKAASLGSNARALEELSRSTSTFTE